MSAEMLVTQVRVFQDDAGEWRWSAKAGNGEVVADSGEGYVNRDYCREQAASMFPHAVVFVEGDPS